MRLWIAPPRRPAVLQAVDLDRWSPAADACRQWLHELLAADDEDEMRGARGVRTELTAAGGGGD